MVRTQVQLSDVQVQALKAKAAREAVSLSEIVRQAVDTFLQCESAISTAERRRRAMEVAGKFRSGKRKTSEQHDAALAEAFR